MKKLTCLLAAACVLPLMLQAQGPLEPALLLKPPTDAWASYHGDYTGRHFSRSSRFTEHARTCARVFYRCCEPTCISAGRLRP